MTSGFKNTVYTICQMIDELTIGPSIESEKEVLLLEQTLGNYVGRYYSALRMNPGHCKDIIAIANGRKLSKQEALEINYDEFDIILDCIQHRLSFRKHPQKHSQLEDSELEGIDTIRISLLKYLIEHPERFISIENASYIVGDTDGMSKDALKTSICVLRKAIKQSSPKEPYILTQKSWEESRSAVYRLNPEWNYLLIK